METKIERLLSYVGDNYIALYDSKCNLKTVIKRSPDIPSTFYTTGTVVLDELPLTINPIAKIVDSNKYEVLMSYATGMVFFRSLERGFNYVLIYSNLPVEESAFIETLMCYPQSAESAMVAVVMSADSDLYVISDKLSIQKFLKDSESLITSIKGGSDVN